MLRVLDLIWPGPFVVQSVHVVARLGIADLLGPEPQTVDELAEAVKADAPSLKRVLRALTTLGVFSEDADGRFRHTELSQTLRADHPASVRAWALMLGAQFVWRPAGDLYESVRTGTPGFRRLDGERFFEWTRTHPEDGAIFNAAMTSGSVQRLPALLAAYDFSRFERIVDVGGGQGALLAGILGVSPKTRGVLYDLPNVVAGAEALRAPDVAERCEVVAGNFFESVPADGDAYISVALFTTGTTLQRRRFSATAGAQYGPTVGSCLWKASPSRRTSRTRTSFSTCGSSAAEASGPKPNTGRYCVMVDLYSSE